MTLPLFGQEDKCYTTTVVFRFALDVGMAPLTGTTDPDHMRADLDVFDFRLEPEEVASIEGLLEP